MGNSGEPISFTSTSLASNGSVDMGNSGEPICPSFGSETRRSAEIVSLSKLSSNLGQLLVDSTCDYSDAEIIVEGASVGVHRCILAARSKFFHERFKKDKGLNKKNGKVKYYLKDMLPFGRVGYEAFMVFLSYVYTGRLKASPPEVSTCVDTACAHDACRPAIDFAVELLYAASIFQVSELFLIFQRRVVNFVDKAFVEDVIPMLVAAFDCQLSQLLTQCVQRVARSNLDDIPLEKELPSEVAEKVKLIRRYRKDGDNRILVDKSEENGGNDVVSESLREKGIKRLHKALDSDDIELVQLLLKESNITLDEANVLHYAVAYCDPKVIPEVLNLGLANVNLRNTRGYTVLHIAAARREPSIVISLLTKGARVSDFTLYGQNAVSICRRLTRPKDYHAITKQGQEANKNRICIDILEREMHRNPVAVDALFSLSTVTDDLHMTLVHLENRVALAQLLFPTEAKLAIDIAQVEIMSKFPGRLVSKCLSGRLREVNLNETPSKQHKRLFSRMESLSKTVAMGRRYFPHCSEVLDQFMEDDLPDFFYLENGTPEEERIKKMRFMELKEDVQRAFNRDKAELRRSGSSPSSSSSSLTELG